MLHNYSYKPEPIFGYKHDRERLVNPLVIGPEIEVEPAPNGANCDEYQASDMVDDIGEGRLYCKPDGSLNYGGFEIVGHPGSLGYHMYVARWKRLFKAVVKTGRRSHDASHCGLHFHVGRAEMGANEADRAKVVRMLQVVMSLYRREMTVFSRRSQSALNQWAPIPVYDWLSRDMSAEQLAEDAEYYLRTYRADHGYRYTAVNITNSATVEFRIFKGTLKRDTFIASMQMVHNMVEWCMHHDWSDVLNSTFTEIACYRPYREVVKYMEHRGLLEGNVVPLEDSNRVCDFATGNA